MINFFSKYLFLYFKEQLRNLRRFYKDFSNIEKDLSFRGVLSCSSEQQVSTHDLCVGFPRSGSYLNCDSGGNSVDLVLCGASDCFLSEEKMYNLNYPARHL